jgi:hypothetical protein
MNIDVHCQECGAITRKDRQDDGTEVLICTNDDCPRIIAAVLSVPNEGPTGVAAFYSARHA